MRKHPARPPHLYPRWTEEEDRFARDFASALVRGAYADALDAARACRAEFYRKKGYSLRHHLEGIHIRIARYARELGRPRVCVRWTVQEKRVLERFARAIVEGRYANTFEAARECRKALAEFPVRGRVGYRSRVVRRSVEAICGKLFLRVKALFGPRHGAYWTPAEDRIVSRMPAT